MAPTELFVTDDPVGMRPSADLPPARQRFASVFKWDAVPNDVLRAILATTKGTLSRILLDADEPLDASNLEDWTSPQLVLAAQQVFGALPPAKRDARFALFVGVLEDAWLPRLAPSQALIAVAHVANGRRPAKQRLSELPNDRRELIKVIRDKLGQAPVKAALRTAFRRAYGVPELREIMPRVRVLSGPVELAGAGRDDLRPYAHQTAAWEALERVFAGGWSATMVVLPTGAGKTIVALDWLLRRMERTPGLRVLWICDGQGLIDQTVREAQLIARQRATGFTCRARAIHSAAGERGTLTDASTSFAAITVQTLAKTHGKTLNSWFARPGYVVVDEAHHAGSDSYERVLDKIERTDNGRGLIGLTATPNPANPRSRARLAKRFPTRCYEIGLGELIAQGILARPIFLPVATHCEPDLDDEQAALLSRRNEIPESVLFEVGNTAERNRLIAEHYLASPAKWGKTLIFTVDIAMADDIADALEEGGATVERIHSGERSMEREAVLDWFRTLPGDGVLVAVSMLNEGVDLPDAKTAFLARPTKNRTMLKQMVGRVLRGEPAGGSAEAYIVDFRDDWPSFAHILGPEAALSAETDAAELDVTSPLGLPPAMRHALRLLFETAWEAPPDSPDDSSAPPPALLQTAFSAELVLSGCFRLDHPEHPLIPVLRHQHDAFDRFAERARDPRHMRSLESFFDDVPDPRPPHDHLRALRECLAEGRATFVDMEVAVGPNAAAELIRAEHAVGDRRLAIMREIHERTPARYTHPDFELFRQAVDRLVDRPPHWCDRGDDHAAAAERPRLKLLPTAKRDLTIILRRVRDKGAALLPYELRDRLGDPPEIRWTRRVVKSTFGVHRLSHVTGQQKIIINRLLCTEAVSDALLDFLCWHELLHHVLLNQQHDAQFKSLEQRWDHAEQRDGELATFHERWETDPAAYRDAPR